MTTDGPEPCCPRFDPAPWEEKRHVWEGKLFIKGSVSQFMHMPLPRMMKKVVDRMWDGAKSAGADPSNEDFLLLATDPSPWKSELYMTVTREVPGFENVRLSGTYLTKVFDGPYNAVPKWIKVMEKYLDSQGENPIKYYIHYTTCPKCAKLYGHNYAIAFAQVR